MKAKEYIKQLSQTEFNRIVDEFGGRGNKKNLGNVLLGMLVNNNHTPMKIKMFAEAYSKECIESTEYIYRVNSGNYCVIIAMLLGATRFFISGVNQNSVVCVHYFNDDNEGEFYREVCTYDDMYHEFRLNGKRHANNLIKYNTIDIDYTRTTNNLNKYGELK